MRSDEDSGTDGDPFSATACDYKTLARLQEGCYSESGPPHELIDFLASTLIETTYPP